MARPIYSIIDTIHSTLLELRQALEPLSSLVVSSSAAAPSAAAAPKRRRRGAARKVAKAPRAPRAPRAPKAIAAAPAAPAAAPKAPRVRTSAPRKAKGRPTNLRALQGKYMAAVRGLSEADKADVRKLRVDQGIDAAIKLATERAK